MVECHPYLCQRQLDQWCADRNISLLCYGTLGSKGTPAEFKGNQDCVIDDAIVRTVTASIDITPAQLLIRLNMSTQQELRVEYVRSPAPSSVKCIVPDQQLLRQPNDDVISSENGGSQSNGVFVPVYNMRVEEAAFTKGDQKLQKVTVTENISDDDNKVVNPMYSEVHSEVINYQQPLRIPKDDGRADEDSESKKSRSRIPKLRQVADKIKQDRKEERENRVPSKQPQRSSIPKFKKAKLISSKDTDILENTNSQEKINTKTVANKNNTNNLPSEEEFDKMFDEIIQNEKEPVLDTNMNINDLEDANKLEHSFEEIIHDYENNKIKPIEVSDIKSTMILVKRKSLPDQAFPKKLNRRSSLKDVLIDYSETDKQSEKKVNKLDEIKNRFLMINRKVTHSPKNLDTQNTTTDTTTNKQEIGKMQIHKSNDKEIKDANKEIDVFKEHQENTLHTKQKNKVEEQPNILDFENESASAINEPEEYVESLKSKDNILQNLKSRELKDISATKEEQVFTLPPKHETNELPKKNTIISKIVVSSNKTATEIETVKLSSKPDIYYSSEISTEDLLDHVKINLARDDSSITLQSTEEKPQKSLEKLNINKPTVLSLKINGTPPNTPQPQVHENENYEDSANIAVDPKTININDKDEGNKGLASNQINVYKSQISNESTTPKHRAYRPKLSTKVVYNKTDEAKSPIIYFESPNSDDFNSAPLFEAYNKKKITEADNKENHLPLHGKVSKINNRITSYKKSTEHYPKIEAPLEIPIKESVSSRIAIFERQVSNPAQFKPNVLQKNLKPKIVEEVLKVHPLKHTTLQDESNIFIQSFELKDQKRSDKKENIVIYENKEHIAKVMEVQNITVGNIKEDVLQNNSNCVDIQKNAIKETEYNNTNDLQNAVEENKVLKEDILSIPRADSDRLIQEKKERKALVKRVQERLSKEKPINAERNLQSKSVVELDLGDAVKGKVHTMIVRMNSVEKLDQEKKQNNINIRERPRKKSVSDKIALFEWLFYSGVLNLQAFAFEDHDHKMLSGVEITDKANTGYENVATVATTPKTTMGKNTTPRSYQNIFSIFTDRAICIDVTSEENNVEKSSTPVTQKMTISRNEENVIESVEITNTGPSTRVDDVVSSTIETTPLETTNTASTTSADDVVSSTTETTPQQNDFYNERIEELKGAAQKYGRVNVTRLKLKNEQEIPALVIGTALLDPILLPHVIGAAIDLGYRAIDTAYIYGNEKAVGEAIQAKINDNTVKREDLFIIGKLWSTFHRQDLVEQACRNSLEQLGLDYFDMYLVHNPMSFKEGGDALPMIANVLQYSEVDYLDTWYEMEELVRKGLARSIGVSNFNSKQIERVADKAKIKPAVNMVECHPYLCQRQLDQWCADRNISLLCYGTLGSKGTPAEFKGNQDCVIDDAIVRTVAASIDITPAQLLIRYQIDSGRAVVTKCSSAAHLWENLQALNSKLGPVEVDVLNALSRDNSGRTYTFIGMGDTHRNYPFKIDF